MDKDLVALEELMQQHGCRRFVVEWEAPGVWNAAPMPFIRQHDIDGWYGGGTSPVLAMEESIRRTYEEDEE